MTEDEREMVKDTIEYEGFDYAFTSYTDFKKNHTVNDPEFHRLIEAFLAARQELADYIGTEA